MEKPRESIRLPFDEHGYRTIVNSHSPSPLYSRESERIEMREYTSQSLRLSIDAYRLFTLTTIIAYRLIRLLFDPSRKKTNVSSAVICRKKIFYSLSR